jgi:hypothetical protein
MIYFENSPGRPEGFNTHVLRYTMAIALSNFLDRDFYFAGDDPSNTPPDYAVSGPYAEKFSILLDSPRSNVEDLVVIPNRRIHTVDRGVKNKIELQVLMSYFFTTEELKRRFEQTFIWNAFGVGRFSLTREELQNYDLIEITHQTLSNPAFAFFLPREEKNMLLASVRIRYIDELESLADRIANDVGAFYAVHVRLGDFLKTYEGELDRNLPGAYRDYVSTTFSNRDLPVLVATNSLEEKDEFARVFDGYKLTFIDELIFDHYGDTYRRLPFTDFNIVTILNQLLGAKAELFIGTYRSTFTSIIHRLRQERDGKKDFHFFPDERVAKLVGESNVLRPDQSGFFDWNRYTVFAQNHHDMSWRREWDHDLTSLDI